MMYSSNEFNKMDFNIRYFFHLVVFTNTCKSVVTACTLRFLRSAAQYKDTGHVRKQNIEAEIVSVSKLQCIYFRYEVKSEAFEAAMETIEGDQCSGLK